MSQEEEGPAAEPGEVTEGTPQPPFLGKGAQSSEKRGCSRTLPLGMATTGLRPGLAQGTWALTKKKGTWLIFPVDQHCRRHEQRSAPPSQTPPEGAG